MTDLTSAQAHALRLKIIDAEGDIAERQRDIAGWKAMLGEDATPAIVTPPATPPAFKPSILPPIAGPLKLWDYNAAWTPSEWTEPKLNLGYPWAGANAVLEGTDLKIRVTEKNSGQVQQNSKAQSSKARWEVDVTLAAQVPGLIQAPLWTYNPDTRDELDFEWVGSKGLQLNVYARGVSVWSKLIPGDYSRHHIAVEYEAGKSVIFIADGVELDRVTPAMTKGGAFPSSPMRAYIEAWPSGAEGWAGKWQGAGAGLTMTVHGFKQS